ncbi:sigma-54-dependent Fis family transcriptional regulator [Caballeronia concitans]|uniref:Fis family GAF modulated sigma54 specific transcriptional regulator n=1 Tax=Caballeronia concitans TaxID=1777133 RepID=A0A658QWM1_9BURK|nr:sigma-54-dependent Fis family transcriptional regulator [Caballeronia concitans]KIG06768.1 GAF modulated sigma54 specific transcriptional regulator, Fis family [Burkholderia sp. MR1]SAL29073.1 Fis family GAF modulated sigma54 specific transcriptional regulator [Caballeronia concitans]
MHAIGAALRPAHRDVVQQDVIRHAHERSATFGLIATMRPEYAVLSASQLAASLEESRTLCAHALPVMETLYAQIANTHSMIALTDASGLILHSLGDDDFLARAQKVALRAGAVWSEAQQGTNAIGTTIAERDAVTVHGDQHYLRANHFLTCSSVPILDPLGNLSGVLDVTGDRRGYHQHTMALVKMSGQMIENRLIASAFREGLRIHFHSRPEFIGTLMEGIAVFDLDGRLLSANRSAQFQLGIELGRLRAQTLASLFGASADVLIARAGETCRLELHNGVGVFASVRFDARRAFTTPSRNAQPASSPSKLLELCTGDPHMRDIVERVRKVIGKPIPILIGGETGAGKEMLARAIHADSPRRAGPFVAVNCASLPETLIESELFGYAQGAFTGAAKRGATGKIVQANGGTLFLDEIGDMPLALQSRLLRVLQERVVEPLGAARATPVDFMLICASNRKLREQVAAGTFREDLYYRVNGLSVTLPPLRARSDLRAVVHRLLAVDGCAGRAIGIDESVLALFERHRWPGNLRQLSNVLRTASAMLDDHDTCIRMEHLPRDFLEEFDDAPPEQAPSPSASDARLADIAVSAVAAALEKHGGNVSATARALGVSRTTVYRKLRS